MTLKYSMMGTAVLLLLAASLTVGTRAGAQQAQDLQCLQDGYDDSNGGYQRSEITEVCVRDGYPNGENAGTHTVFWMHLAEYDPYNEHTFGFRTVGSDGMTVSNGGVLHTRDGEAGGTPVDCPGLKYSYYQDDNYSPNGAVASWSVPHNCMPDRDTVPTTIQMVGFVTWLQGGGSDTTGPLTVRMLGTDDPSDGPSTDPTDEPGPTPTETETAQPADPDRRIVRLAGGSRMDTAVQVSSHAWPDGNDRLAVVNGYNYPDALGAHNLNGYALLMVNECSIPDSVAAEMRRLDPLEIYIIGGDSTLCPDMMSMIETVLD